MLLLSGGKSASQLRLYRKCRCTQNGCEWIRALPLEPCGLFKGGAFCLKMDQNLNQGMNSSNRHQLGSIRQTQIERELWRESEGKGRKGH